MTTVQDLEKEIQELQRKRALLLAKEKEQHLTQAKEQALYTQQLLNEFLSTSRLFDIYQTEQGKIVFTSNFEEIDVSNVPLIKDGVEDDHIATSISIDQQLLEFLTTSEQLLIPVLQNLQTDIAGIKLFPIYNGIRTDYMQIDIYTKANQDRPAFLLIYKKDLSALYVLLPTNDFSVMNYDAELTDLDEALKRIYKPYFVYDFTFDQLKTFLKDRTLDITFKI